MYRVTLKHGELPCAAGRGGGTASGELRLQPVDDDVGADAARALDEHEIAGRDRLQREVGRLGARRHVDAPAAAGMPAWTRRVGQARAPDRRRR